LRSGAESESGIDEALLAVAEREGIMTKELRVGDTVQLSPQVHFDVLFPSVDPSEMDPNDASIVGRLVYGDTAFLLSGDAPKLVEKYLAQVYGENLKSNVLKIGHHGSDTSSALSWIGWSQPKYAVVSAGEDNSYGHPHDEVIDRLNRIEIEILETAMEGTIVFESDGKRVQLIK
jgi:competence protein ComEC